MPNLSKPKPLSCRRCSRKKKGWRANCLRASRNSLKNTSNRWRPNAPPLRRRSGRRSNRPNSTKKNSNGISRKSTKPSSPKRRNKKQFSRCKWREKEAKALAELTLHYQQKEADLQGRAKQLLETELARQTQLLQERLSRDYAVRQEDLERQKRELTQRHGQLEEEFKKESIRFRADIEQQRRELAARQSTLEAEFKQKIGEWRSEFEKERQAWQAEKDRRTQMLVEERKRLEEHFAEKRGGNRTAA